MTNGTEPQAGRGTAPTNVYELIYKVAREWGIFAAMSIFFVWTNWQREIGLSRRIDANEAYIREELSSVIKGNTAANIASTATLQRLHETNGSVLEQTKENAELIRSLLHKQGDRIP